MTSTYKSNAWFNEFEQQLIHEHFKRNNDQFQLRRAIDWWELGHAHFVSLALVLAVTR
jgi:hypothetical protein